MNDAESLPNEDVCGDPAGPAVPQQRRQFHTLKQAAAELGMGYERAQALAAHGYFGKLTRSGPKQQGPYLIPEATLRKLRNGERVGS